MVVNNGQSFDEHTNFALCERTGRRNALVDTSQLSLLPSTVVMDNLMHEFQKFLTVPNSADERAGTASKSAK
ncbi:unnamed protein product [Soboliphyme baturini]|uniref:Uncharacterized protein n=1 Tax=Soboliphyme baturini TaxID=241478 RepID=A0A183IY55_9BILA|nr:unnamed protein product [Soboliphyme baturini]